MIIFCVGLSTNYPQKMWIKEHFGVDVHVKGGDLWKIQPHCG
ncbi:MAG: hypothetical protein ACKVTZ_02125 [Bacteroidia bacterium]